MVYRKLYKQGNSVVFSVPSYMLDRAGIDAGDYFLVEQVSSGVIHLTGTSKASIAEIARKEMERRASST
jgi:antitoxin component of MazEF toxin-antitoxin module